MFLNLQTYLISRILNRHLRLRIQKFHDRVQFRFELIQRMWNHQDILKKQLPFSDYSMNQLNFSQQILQSNPFFQKINCLGLSLLFIQIMRPKKHLLGHHKNSKEIDFKEETKKMEDKLNQLKLVMKKQKNQREIKSGQRFEPLDTKKQLKSKEQQKLNQIVPPIQTSQQIHQFLMYVNLGQYESKFIANGIDSMQILQEIKKQNLEEIGIIKGHAIKIIKGLEKYKNEKPLLKINKTSKQQKKQLEPLKSTTRESTRNVIIQSFSTQTNFMPNSGKSTQKVFCQKCFEGFLRESNSNKKFCSEKCEQLYIQENIVTCYTCKSQKERWECYKYNDKHYCSEECFKQVLSQLQKQQQQTNKAQQEQEQNEFYLMGSEDYMKSGIDKNQVEQIKKYLKEV